MPTVSTHLPEATYRRLRKTLGLKGNPSAFLRQAVEEKLASLPPKVSYGSMIGTVTFAPDYDPSEPAFPASDFDDGDAPL